MPTVAEQLRTAREAYGLTVHEVAEITKIKTEHIRALESGDYQIFAAPVYIRGFIRTYARVLRLDPDELALALDAELSDSGVFHEPGPSVPHRHGFLDELMLHVSKVHWRLVLPLIGVTVIVVALILGYRWYTERRDRDPLSDLGSGQYRPGQAQQADTLPLPSTNQP